MRHIEYGVRSCRDRRGIVVHGILVGFVRGYERLLIVGILFVGVGTKRYG
jgi:hypothetical protein